MPRLFALALLPALVACNGDTGEDYPEGCILVDDEGGYAYLADALEVAEEGSVITLCGTDIVEKIEAAKSVTIRGEGARVSQWFPPTNEPALIVRPGATVTVQALGITSTRNAITVMEGGVLIVEDMEINEAGSYGIEATNAQVTAANIVIEQTLWGAIRVNGGTLDLTGSRLQSNTSWGVLVENEGSAIIHDSLIRSTYPSDSEASQWDGWGVGVKSQGLATITATRLDQAVLGSVLLEDRAKVEVDDVQVGDGFFGFWVSNAELVVTNSAADDVQLYSVLAEAGSTIDISGSTFANDPATSLWEDATNFLEGAYGILMQNAASLDVTDSSFEGFNGGALWIAGSLTLPMPMNLTRVEVRNNGTQGILAQSVVATFEDVTIADTRNNDPACTASGGFDCNWGAALLSANVVWTGGEVSGNDYLGVFLAEGSLQATGVDFRDNAEVGMLAFDAAVTLEQAEATGVGGAVLDIQDSVVLLRNIAFKDRSYDYVFESGTTRIVGYDEAIDIYGTNAELTLEDVTFSNGNTAFDLTFSELTAVRTTFDDYLVGIDQWGGSVDLEGVAFTNGGAGVSCTGSGELDLEDVSFENLRNHTYLTEIYTSGVLTSTTQSIARNAAVNTNSCVFTATDLTATTGEENAITLANTSATLQSVAVAGFGTLPLGTDLAAVDIVQRSGSANVFANDLSVDGMAAGHGLRIASHVSDTAPAVTLVDVDIDNVSGDGVVFKSLLCATPPCDVSMTHFDIATAGGRGIALIGAVVTLNEPTISATGVGAVTATTGDGIRVERFDPNDTVDDDEIDSALVLDNVTIASAGASGVSVLGGTHSVEDLTVTSAAGYAMSCATDPPDAAEDVPVFDLCGWVALTGDLGQFSGCEACQPPL